MFCLSRRLKADYKYDQIWENPPNRRFGQKKFPEKASTKFKVLPTQNMSGARRLGGFSQIGSQMLQLFIFIYRIINLV